MSVGRILLISLGGIVLAIAFLILWVVWEAFRPSDITVHNTGDRVADIMILDAEPYPPGPRTVLWSGRVEAGRRSRALVWFRREGEALVRCRDGVSAGEAGLGYATPHMPISVDLTFADCAAMARPRIRR